MTELLIPRDHSSSVPRKTPRLLSLDVFRGIAVFVMLLVNNIGHAPGVPATLHHAAWNETIHLADLAYPWFLFAIGIAIPFSAASFAKTGQSRRAYYLRVLRRMLLLLLIGFALSSIYERHLMLGFGVLQLIGIDFAIAAVIYQRCSPRYRALISGLLLVGYWSAILFIPIPQLGAGLFAERLNLIDFVNYSYLAPIGLWGLPQIVPTTALVLLGTLTGDFLRAQTPAPEWKSLWLTGAGAALIVLGTLWSLTLPFNKPIWTPPFILFTGGTGALLLGLLHYRLDVRMKRRWAFPFSVFGANALLVYALSVGVMDGIIIPRGWFTPGWLPVSLYISAWWVVCWVLYRKQWFLRV